MARRFLNGIDLSGTKAINAADPSNSGDLVNLGYLQNFVRGLTWGESVLAATTENIDLSSPGASIDGISLSEGSRVLVKNQSDATENGVYRFVGSDSDMVRTTDMSDGSTIRSGRATTVISGLVNDNSVFVLSNDTPTVEVGVDELEFVRLGGGNVSYSAGNGLTLTDETFSVDLRANSGLAVDSTGLAIATSAAGNGLGISDGVLSVNVGQHLQITSDTVSVDTTDLVTNPNTVVRKYAAAVPSGNTSATITHNLGTRDVTVAVFENDNGYDQVYPDIQHTTTNSITLVFAVAPSTNEFRVVVHG